MDCSSRAGKTGISPLSHGGGELRMAIPLGKNYEKWKGEETTSRTCEYFDGIAVQHCTGGKKEGGIIALIKYGNTNTKHM